MMGWPIRPGTLVAHFARFSIRLNSNHHVVLSSILTRQLSRLLTSSCRKFWRWSGLVIHGLASCFFEDSRKRENKHTCLSQGTIVPNGPRITLRTGATALSREQMPNFRPSLKPWFKVREQL